MPDPTIHPTDDADLETRLRAVAAWGDPGEVPDLADLRASTIDLAPLRSGRSLRQWVPLTAAAAVAAVVVGIIAITAPGDDGNNVEGGTDFATAIEVSGVLTSPSADDVEQAMDYQPQSGPTEVAADGHYVALRTCLACSGDWAYVTGNVDGTAATHHGLLDLTGPDVSVHLVDDRYFVALSEGGSEASAPGAWLIDAVSGKAGPLSWSEEPTTLTSHEQALVLRCKLPWDWECPIAGVPSVVDAHEGTIRPMAMPDDAVPGSAVAQRTGTRVWVATRPEGDSGGLVYTDDGGATWTEVALPEQLRSTGGDDLLITADGDRVAVTTSWVPDRIDVYVSEDDGRSWTTATNPSDPGGANIAHLYFLADGRLVLMWSSDAYPQQVLASTGSDWAALERIDVPYLHAPNYFTVNRAGTAFGVNKPGTFVPGTPSTNEISTDLTNWRTIEGLDD